jgi:glycerol-1-phosphatase
MASSANCRPRGLHCSRGPLADAYDCALLDLDGVVYVEGEALNGVPDVLAQARGRGLKLAFVTNNASRPPAAVAQRLCELGVPAEASDVVTSAQAAAREVARRVPSGSEVLLVGGDGLAAALAERGLKSAASSADAPAAVLQGFGPDVSWRQLADAAVAIRSGAVWIASNTDLTIPTSRGPVPGNGALVNAVAAAVGARPTAVAGKPFPPLFDETIDRVGCKRPLVVGDRLDTDIEGAHAIAADSLLVLTGVTEIRELCRAAPTCRPSFVAWTLSGLVAPHPVPELGTETSVLNGWLVRRSRDELRIEQRGQSRDDGLRAVVALAWAVSDVEPDATLRIGDAEALGSLG